MPCFAVAAVIDSGAAAGWAAVFQDCETYALFLCEEQGRESAAPVGVGVVVSLCVLHTACAAQDCATVSVGDFAAGSRDGQSCCDLWAKGENLGLCGVFGLCGVWGRECGEGSYQVGTRLVPCLVSAVFSEQAGGDENALRCSGERACGEALSRGFRFGCP